MSDTESKSPNYVICSCEHCDGHIEFNANEFTEENSIVPCPHCGLETKIFISTLQTEKVRTDLASFVASQNLIRREGFFCGEGAVQEPEIIVSGDQIPVQAATAPPQDLQTKFKFNLR
jgi:NAD-dependent SIR2 family protein deacetylase